ncbi:hypothetical protein EIP86_007272, partial [Pleurotus ostreatoroseus]
EKIRPVRLGRFVGWQYARIKAGPIGVRTVKENEVLDQRERDARRKYTEKLKDRNMIKVKAVCATSREQSRSAITLGDGKSETSGEIGTQIYESGIQDERVREQDDEPQVQDQENQQASEKNQAGETGNHSSDTNAVGKVSSNTIDSGVETNNQRQLPEEGPIATGDAAEEELIKAPTNWSPYRSWESIPALDPLRIPDLKSKIGHILGKTMVEGVTWRYQAQERKEAFYIAVAERCGVDLARYENHWPAEAVARVALIQIRAQLKKMPREISTKLRRQDSEEMRTSTRRSRRPKFEATVSSSDEDIGETDAQDMTRSRKVDKQGNKRRAENMTTDEESMGEGISSRRKRRINIDDTNKKQAKSRAPGSHPIHTDSDTDQEAFAHTKRNAARLAKANKDDAQELEEAIDDEELVAALRKSGVRTVAHWRNMANWAKDDLYDTLSLMCLNPFQIGDVVHRLMEMKDQQQQRIDIGDKAVREFAN